MAQVGVNLGDGLTLVWSQREGQPLQEAAAEARPAGQHRCLGPPRLGRLVEQQPDLQQIQLLEDEPAARRASVRQAARRVQRDQRVAARRQTGSQADRRRQRVRHATGKRQQTMYKRAQQAGGELFAGRIDGYHALGVQRLLPYAEQFVALHQQRGTAAARTQHAAQADGHAGLEDFGQVALIEPERLQDAAAVAHRSAHHLQSAAPRRHQLGTLHDDAHGGLLAQAELSQAAALTVVIVAARVVLQKVADRGDAEPGEPAGRRRADGGDARERSG